MKIFVLTIMIGLWSSCAYAQDHHLVLATSEYPPYHSEVLPHKGFVSRIVYAAYKAAGYDAEIIFYPWLRAVMLASEDRVDGVFSIWKTSAREKEFWFSEPLSPPTVIGFYKRKTKDIQFSSYADLQHYKIGSVLGYSYPDDFINADLRNDKSYDDKTLIRQLLSSKIDLAVIEQGQAHYLMSLAAPHKLHEFEFMDKVIDVKELYLAISKNIPQAQAKVEAFNEGLKIIKDNGLYQKIIESR